MNTARASGIGWRSFRWRPEGLYTPVTSAVVIHDREVFELQSQVIRETAARENCVVIGRSGSGFCAITPAASASTCMPLPRPPRGSHGRVQGGRHPHP